MRVQDWLPAHFLVGFLLIPPLALKLASTGYRAARYYMGNPGYRLAGPPHMLLRLSAPILVISTGAVFASGIELWLFGLRFGNLWVAAHKLSFVVFSVATGVHVLGHLHRSGEAAVEEVAGGRSPEALTRRSLVIGSLVVGAVLAAASLLYATPFQFLGDGG